MDKFVCVFNLEIKNQCILQSDRKITERVTERVVGLTNLGEIFIGFGGIGHCNFAVFVAYLIAFYHNFFRLSYKY